MQKEIFKHYDIHTKSFTLNGKKTFCRLVNIIDGDSLVVILPIFDDYYKYHIRINGIDTCEMKSKVKENKETAIRARNRVLQLVGLTVEDAVPYTRKKIQTMLDENVIVVWVHCHGTDKYGRLLGDIYTSADPNGKSIAKMLIEEKLAYEYYGETKMTEEQQAEVM